MGGVLERLGLLKTSLTPLEFYVMERLGAHFAGLSHY
jgi:hypothetical protein